MPTNDEEALQVEFPVGHVCLALFPSTTCLYRAIVVANPSKVCFHLFEAKEDGRLSDAF